MVSFSMNFPDTQKIMNNESPTLQIDVFCWLQDDLQQSCLMVPHCYTSRHPTLPINNPVDGTFSSVVLGLLT